MVFHVPYRLNPQATSASGIRPVKMRAAFETLGYDVLEVSGSVRERGAQMKNVRREIKAGRKIEFVYSESSTRPNAFSESFRTPHPFLDNSFLRFCRQHDIPVGLFYRDIYWKFSDFTASVGRLAATVLRSFYLLDVLGYRSATDILFVPSMRMAEVVPFTRLERCEALPPASDPVTSANPRTLTLFYVGGLGTHYRLHEAVRAVGAVDGAKLTICAPQQQWQGESASYADVLTDATQVVHASGADLETFYAQASMGCLFLEPIGYREFAAPFKLYEYLGHGKPIIAAQGTLAGDFVEANDIGWAIPYTSDALVSLLEKIKKSPKLLEDKAANALRVREAHTWSARAAQVAKSLADIRGTRR